MMLDHESFLIRVPNCPKSVNAGGAGYKQHHMAAHQEKMKWERLYGLELLAARVRKGMVFCEADFRIEFREKRKRDSTNWILPVIKPFADCLVKGGWLDDDDDAHFLLAGFRTSSSDEWPYRNRLLTSMTTICLKAKYQEHIDRAAA